MDDELLDLVDENDSIIGTLDRKDYSKLIEDNLGYIRFSELFILNDEGKLWVPIRTAAKAIAPNGYDFSAAGHVGSGATYLDTAIREAKEEINLDITKDQIEFVAKTKREDEKFFRSIYFVRSNTTPEFNADDFVSAEWLTPTELLANIDEGHSAKSDLREAVVKLQDYLQSH